MIRIERKGWGVLLAVLLLIFFQTVSLDKASAATTSLTVTKLASDGETVIAERTVDYQWLMDNLPVMGDGNTNYYHQGPVFIDDPDEATQEELRWNPEEDTNVEEKDMGAVQGTNVTDLCDLVGGMADGELLAIKAEDGLSKEFAYKNVYEYSDQEGPMVICWAQDGNTTDSGYDEGMRLVWFADDSTNPYGIHAFGNWDWHEAADEDYWYYFYSGGEEYPTTTGLSIQNVSELIIYSNEDPPEAPEADFSANRTSGTAPLTVRFTDESANSPTSWEWDFDGDGTVDSDEQEPTYKYREAGTYDVILEVSNGAGDGEETKTDYIVIGEKPATDVLFDGEVVLGQGDYYYITASNSGTERAISQTTALGALQAASEAATFFYAITDLNYSGSGILLLDAVESYTHDESGNWYVYINDVPKDYYNEKAYALNLMELVSGDEVDFYYAEDIEDSTAPEEVKEKAIAIINTAIRIKPATKPTAAFTAAPVEGRVPLTVAFTSQATGTGILTYAWDFENDGTVDSPDINPSHIYSAPGTYTVKLKVTNMAGSDEEIKTNCVRVTSFDDIFGHWAQVNIENLLSRGAVGGYPDGNFRPDATITRAEFATMLVRAFKYEAETGKVFADTADHWAKASVSTAAARGIVNGYDADSFGPDDLITREQMAVMMAKAVSIDTTGGETTFTDNNSISEWAQGSVAAAVRGKIMGGYLDNTFQPLGSATRAEAVSTIVNALDAP